MWRKLRLHRAVAYDNSDAQFESHPFYVSTNLLADILWKINEDK